MKTIWPEDRHPTEDAGRRTLEEINRLFPSRNASSVSSKQAFYMLMPNGDLIGDESEGLGYFNHSVIFGPENYESQDAFYKQHEALRIADLDNSILDLIRNPAFPSKVNDIAVECGNSLYQPILDRYMASEEIPLSEVRQVSRNTTQAMCGLSGFFEELFPLVRRLNQKLPPEKKLRVLAGDPPPDWSNVQRHEDLRGTDRDANIASVMGKEVLSKHRKALMLFGTFHLLHAGSTARTFPSAVEFYENNYLGVTLVIAEREGFGNCTPLAKYNDEFEARMTPWPIPSLVQQLKGTWLADLLDMTYSPGAINIRFIQGPSGEQAQIVPIVFKGYSKMVDAYLYLGPGICS